MLHRLAAVQAGRSGVRGRYGELPRDGCGGCNPGAAAHAFGLDPARTRACLRGEFSLARFRACMAEPAVGARRPSVGMATCPHDSIGWAS